MPKLRDSRPDDVPTLSALYGQWVTHGLARFERTPPDVPEMVRRRQAVLIERCTASGHRLRVAIIGDSANAPSIRQHEGADVTRARLISAAGWEHERWMDSGLTVRPLGEGAAMPPAP